MLGCGLDQGGRVWGSGLDHGRQGVGILIRS